MKNRIIVLILIVAPIIATTCFFLRYYKIGCLSPSDWLAYTGSMFSYFGTVVVSLIALGVSSREHKVVFQISGVEYKSVVADSRYVDRHWDNDVNEILFFTELEHDPANLVAYKVTILNYSMYPITQIDVKGFGYNENKKKLKGLRRQATPFIKPNCNYTFAIEYCPNFYDSHHVQDTYQITCKNIFEAQMIVQLTIFLHEKDGVIQTGYSQKILKSYQ